MHKTGSGKQPERLHWGVMIGERVVNGDVHHLLPTYWSSQRPLFAQPMRRMPLVVQELGELAFWIVRRRLPDVCKEYGPPNSCVLMRYTIALNLHDNPHRCTDV